MIKIWLFFSALVLFLAGVPLTASASCVASSLEEQKERADIILIGTVSKILDGRVNISVEKYFKGRWINAVTVTGRAALESGAITSVDFEMVQGNRYLLFLKGNPPELLTTNACSGSREIDGNPSAEETKVLGAGYVPLVEEADEKTTGIVAPLNAQNNFVRLISNPIVLLLLIAWMLPWKGFALWKAARREEKVWFIILLLVNTLAILEILYIFFFSRKLGEKLTTEMR